MIVNTNVVVKSTVNLAKKQLEVHAKQGSKSNLSIYEVARLMDTIRHQNNQNNVGKDNTIFNFSHN
ncbi:MAG: hypothetical protein WED10_11385 [Brumimicrobium sp.]